MRTGVSSLRTIACGLVLATACSTGSSTTYCSSDIGLVNAPDVPNVGPIETCTTQYPTCTPPNAMNAGWVCCVDTPAPDDGGSVACMPTGSAADGATE
jgi:hypothetical protein